MMIALLLSLAVMDGDQVVQTAPAGAGVVPPVAADAPSINAASIDTPHGLTTDQQIDRWLAANDARERAADGQPLPERRVSGEVVVGVGTGGYRDVGVRIEGPVGDGGWGGFTYRQSERDWR